MGLAKLSKRALDHMQLPVSLSLGPHYSCYIWSFIVWCIIIFLTIIIMDQVRNVLVGRILIIFNIYKKTAKTNLLGGGGLVGIVWLLQSKLYKVIVNGYKKHDSCGEWWWLCPPCWIVTHAVSFSISSFFIIIQCLLILVSYTVWYRA